LNIKMMLIIPLFILHFRHGSLGALLHYLYFQKRVVLIGFSFSNLMRHKLRLIEGFFSSCCATGKGDT